MLTKGKGEDAKEVEDEEESNKEEEPVKKKGKVIITKPPKTSTIFFTRRTRKKADKEGGDVIFNQPLPTFQERLKILRERAGVHNFKALKYETRTLTKQKEVEDLVMDKMGQWKYSPD